jgi:ABC-2 type transport system permease protein
MRKIIKSVFRRASIFPASMLGFIVKEYSLLVKKKKYLYLSLSLPLVIGLIYIFTLTTGAANVNVKVCDYDNTELTREAFTNIKDFTVTMDTNGDCINETVEEIKDGKYLFGIIVEKGFTDNVKNLKQAELTLFYDNSDPSVTSIASWKMDAALGPFKDALVTSFAQEIKDKSSSARDKTQLALELIDASGGLSSVRQPVQNADADLARLASIDTNYVVSPIVTKPQGVHAKYKLIDIGIAPLFVVLNLFIVLMLCSTGVIYDKKMRLIQRIRVSNSSMTSYIISKIIIFLSITIAEFLIMVILFFAFGARFSVSFLILAKALVFIASVNSLIGFLIGLVSDNEGVAVLISLTITLPLLFLSGMFYPLQMMPVLVQWLSKLLPLEVQVWMMKQAMLFGGEISGNYFCIPLALFFACLYLIRKHR